MISADELGTAIWRTSSYSNGEGGACVSVADGFPGALPVRDTKCPEGATLIFPAGSWAAFVRTVKGSA
ncbi:DUF397 domain-containing protein [Streptomyces sp. NBC_01186]|uniref:DUF397 domain-containing protein n=1 Tax=unclassified Streptomyces TaxID=2593676 RepID=UPI002DDBE407|nr:MULTISPECIES: DUF397 domain-containing protein [unclassified Streptomyces]WSB76518.1 DUF397 domain-containing protein [Streptomyces sp. NBC_01775]WSS15193.1 DUF397 domain-containing protein [Streptomyces sp. NBC_01186]